MLLRANNRSGYMRSKPWCFCLSLLFSSLSNKIAHTAASTLRADFIYKLAAASWLCHRLFENADRSCNNSVPLHKKKQTSQPAAFARWIGKDVPPGRAPLSHLGGWWCRRGCRRRWWCPSCRCPRCGNIRLGSNSHKQHAAVEVWSSSLNLLGFVGVFFLPPCTKCGLMSGRSRPHRLHNNIINA